MTAVPSVAWTFCRSVGALGLVVACGCSLSPKIYGMSSCCKALLVLRASNLSLLLGGVELVCASLEARGLERTGVQDAVVGTSLPVWMLRLQRALIVQLVLRGELVASI